MSLCWVILGGRLRGLSKLQERQGEKNAWHAEKSKPCLSTPTGSGRERGLTVSYVFKINCSKTIPFITNNVCFTSGHRLCEKVSGGDILS